MDYRHTPVLLQEVLEYLNPQPGDIVVDGTLGGGGHSKEIAKRIEPNGFLLGIDLDPAAIKEAEKVFQESEIKTRYRFVHGNYADIAELYADVAKEFKLKSNPNKILVDVGISSYDLEGSNRGFSFQKDEPLDMRFNPEAVSVGHQTPRDAAYLINHLSKEQLQKIFSEYGEERFSGRIASGIIARRESSEIKTTAELLDVIRLTLPANLRYTYQNSARRIFQSLRIEVNHELENIQRFLPTAFELLPAKGLLAVISFHSLEDRAVKRFAQELVKGCVCPPDFPECRCDKKPLAKILSKKPVIAGEAEISENSRSRPAKLRIIEKL
jgi:16S rRNA (cytosine1402-N4)-methyltransferase